MKGLIHTRFFGIGFKLILMIVVMLTMAMGVLIFFSTRLVTEFGEYSARVNEQNIKEKTSLFLSKIMDEQAMSLEGIFQKISLSSAVVARQAAMLTDQVLARAKDSEHSYHFNLSYHPKNQFYSNPASAPLEILYWGKQGITREIERELDMLSRIGPLLIQLKEAGPESSAAYVVTESNLLMYYPNVHFVTGLKPVDEYNLKSGIWYRSASPENNPDKQTVWTPVYQDEAGQGLMTSAITPVYSKNGSFIGVAGIDVTLDKIIQEILSRNTLEGAKGSSSGMFSFILDAQGRIVAFPKAHMALFGLKPQKSSVDYGSVSDQSLASSGFAPVKTLMDEIISQKKQTGRVVLGQASLLISSQFMPSTGWFLCMVIPEAFILSSVEETRAAIDLVVNKMNFRLTGATILFLVICALVIVVFLSRQFIVPLNQLIIGASKVKEGDLDSRLDEGARDEMGLLIRTFNTMVAGLKESGLREKEHTRLLEQTVRERTEQIFQKNKEQTHTLALLEKESRERSEIQKALIASQEKYRDIFENCVEGIFQSTPDHKLLRANPAMARIWGYDSPKDMLTSVADVRMIYKNPEDRKILLQTLETDQTISGFEFPGIKKDGSEMWISLSARAVRDEKGQFVHILGSCENISERKTAETAIQKASELAKEANLAKTRFLATMSHEIRTPMNAVIGMTDLLLKTPLTKKQQNYLGVVDQSSRHLLSLIDDILDISAIEAMKIDVENHPFDLKRLLAEVTGMFADKAALKNIHLTYDLQDVPVFLKGDEARLRQVLVNLVNNAVKFTPQGNILILAAPPTNPLEEFTPEYGESKKIPVHFSVSDTGIGIPEDQFDHIFDEFSQLGNSLSRVYGGTGLGLAICRRLVALMGGRIHLHSEVEKGTTFYFTLAFESSSRKEAEESCIPVSEIPLLQEVCPPLLNPSTGKPCHILLAEDYEVNQEVITPVLIEQGWEVTTVANGREAVEAVEDHEFDLILMDVQMPVMDGLEATRKIRALANPVKSGIPIIALTAHALKGDRKRFLKVGMDEYLAKPVHSSELVQVISKMLKQAVPEGGKVAGGSMAFLDLDAALARTDYNQSLLETTCRAVIKHLPGNLVQLEKAAGQSDFTTAARIAHSIKTASKSVGAAQAAETAYDLEQAGNKEQKNRLATLLPILKSQATQMLDALKKYMGGHERL